VRFSKWHALGNDYLLVERADAGGPLAAAAVRRLCDVHTGIGADGVLEVVAADTASAEVVVWNPDGSTAELSGNGTRIAARWLAAKTGASVVRIRVGEREVVARMHDDGVLVEQQLGEVAVGDPETIDVAGEAVELIAVSVGNPHAVVRRDPSRDELLRLGPAIERHPRFPERTNAQLVRVDGPHDLTAAVWERGAGETSASGTSACAVAAAAVARGWCESPVTVHMPGGDLEVAIESGRARLTGPAEEVFKGWLEAAVASELKVGRREASNRPGFTTPEEAALASFPGRFAYVEHVTMSADGSSARVSLAAANQPPDPWRHTVLCERTDMGWIDVGGAG
jgi:diaminopimelate epimerase